jgi:hypothetical protein
VDLGVDDGGIDSLASRILERREGEHSADNAANISAHMPCDCKKFWNGRLVDAHGAEEAGKCDEEADQVRFLRDGWQQKEPRGDRSWRDDVLHEDLDDRE